MEGVLEGEVEAEAVREGVDDRVGDFVGVEDLVIEVEGLGDFETLLVGEKVAFSVGLGGMMSVLEGVLEAVRVLEVVGV